MPIPERAAHSHPPNSAVTSEMRVAKHFVHPRQRWMAMSNDDPTPTALAPQDGKRIRQPPKSSWFDVPPALKRIFDKFPLVTYDENELPLRASSRRREEHVLYVFATEEDARAGRPSFNPQCLRWQVGHAQRHLRCR